MKFRNRFGVETTVISQPIPERWETSGSTTYLGYGGDESKPMAIHKIEETSTGGTRKMAWGIWADRANLQYQSVNSNFITEE